MKFTSDYILKKWQHTALSPVWSILFVSFVSLLAGYAVYLFRVKGVEADNTTLDFLPFVAGIASVIASSSVLNRTVLDVQATNISAALQKIQEGNDSHAEKIKQSNEILGLQFESQRQLFTKDFQKLSDKLSAMAQRSKTFQKLGAVEIASSGLPDRISNAKDVSNTFVLIQNKYANSDGVEGVTNTYERWLSNGLDGQWTDIMGVREFFSNRISAMPPSQSYIGEHRVFVAKHSMPIINFVILSYPDGRPTEVVFGWLPNDKFGESELFSTFDPSIVKLFQSYFDILKEYSWNYVLRGDYRGGFLIDYTIEGNKRLEQAHSRLVDKEGNWVTLSYAKKGESGEHSITRIGYLTIKATDVGISVRARIYSSATGQLEEDETEHREIAHYMDSVFIGYRLHDENLSGICHYKFRRFDHGEVLQGIYVDRRDERRNVLIGIHFDEFSEVAQFRPSTAEVMQHIANFDQKFRNFPNFKTLLKGPEVID